MNKYQIQVPLHNLPLILVLVSDGSVAVVKTASLAKAIYQDFEVVSKQHIIFSEDGFTIDSEQYQYSMLYKLELYNNLKRWLCSENLSLPEHIHHAQFH